MYSFIAVAILMSLFTTVTVSLSVALLYFCRKNSRNKRAVSGNETVRDMPDDQTPGAPLDNTSSAGGGVSTDPDGDSLLEMDDLDDLDYSDVEVTREHGGACYYQLEDDCDGESQDFDQQDTGSKDMDKCRDEGEARCSEQIVNVDRNRTFQLIYSAIQTFVRKKDNKVTLPAQGTLKTSQSLTPLVNRHTFVNKV